MNSHGLKVCMDSTHSSSPFAQKRLLASHFFA
jgi:hypothetical protein